MGNLIYKFELGLDRQYARLLRFFLRLNEATQAIFSESGNSRYLRELRAEHELLKGQLDRLVVRIESHQEAAQ